MNRQDRASSERPEQTRLKGRQWALLVLLTLASFIVVLDPAEVFIPLPSILRDLGGTLDEGTWVFAAFILAFAIFLLPSTRLAASYGRRLLFILGITVFALASLACALAPSMEFLIGARVAQGMGAAMVEPTALMLIKATIPQGKLSRALGIQANAAALGAALGPILGGAITTGLSWEYVFALNVVVGLVILVGALFVIPAPRAEETPAQLDVPGLLFGGASLICLVFAIIEGARLGWGSVPIVSLFAAAVVLLLLFVIAERRVREPLVDLTLFANRRFAVGNVLRAAGEFASLGVFFALSHFLQVQLGYSALITGLLLMSVIGGALLAAPLTEALAGRADVRWLVIPGFLLVAGGTFWVAHLSPETTWAFFIAPLAIVGAGFGALESPTEHATQSAIPGARADTARHVSYTIYLLGIGLGVAVVSGVWQSQLLAHVSGPLSSAANLPAGVAESSASSLAAGGMSGQLPTQLSSLGLARITDLIQEASANAVNTALLSCVAVALLGAVVALFFSSGQREEAKAAHP